MDKAYTLYVEPPLGELGIELYTQITLRLFLNVESFLNWTSAKHFIWKIEFSYLF